MKQLATEMQQKLQILETVRTENRAPRAPLSHETVKLLQYCTPNGKQTTIIGG